MIQFNPDGSIRIPGHVQAQKDKKKHMWIYTKCTKIRKEVTAEKPKKCFLHLELSLKWDRNDFVKNIFKDTQGETPMKIHKKNEKEFTLEVGSSFRRCSDCTKLVGRYREHSNGNFILEKGTCTYEPRQFSEEDYFD